MLHQGALSVNNEQPFKTFAAMIAYAKASPGKVGVDYTLHVPKDTPRPVIERLSAAVAAALQKDEVKAALARTGLSVINAPPAEAQRRHAEATRFFTAMVRNSGIPPE